LSQGVTELPGWIISHAVSAINPYDANLGSARMFSAHQSRYDASLLLLRAILIHRKDTASGVFPRLDRPPADTLDRARLLLIFRRLFYRRPANRCDNRTERRSRRRNGRHQGTAARKTRSTFLCENSVAATN
jgi:hypothetical protein